MTRKRGPRGVGPVMNERHVDEREAREQAAIADIEARVARGELTGEGADREILEIVLRERFAFLPPESIEELRMHGLELLEEPELVETRSFYAAGSEPDTDG